MKKLLLFAIAAMSMVACVKEEVTVLPKGDAIAFSNAFINSSTRAAVDPSITTATLSGFNVWGFVKESDGEIFNGIEVKKNNNVWGYDGTQYWVPNQPYYFAALAPMNSTNWSVIKATGEDAKMGLGIIEFTNVDGTEDLLYAKEMVTSKGLNEENGSVKFQFQHLLSKVKFTFENGFPAEAASIKVTNVKMEVPASAEIDLAQADYSKAWTSHADTQTLEFGDVEKLAYAQSAEVANERLTIPASAEQRYIITFDVELFMGAQSVYEVTKTSEVVGYELEMGNAYNFVAEINPNNLDLEEIVFDVENVEGWVPEGGQQIEVEDYHYDEASDTYIVSTATGFAEFAEDINNGTVPAAATVVLDGDIDLNNIQSRAITSNWTPIGTGASNPFTGTFDGNGYSIKNFNYTVTGDDEAWYVGIFGYAKNATIKNLVMENVTIYSEKAYFAEVGAVVGHLEGTSTLENITIKGDVKIEGNVNNPEASRIGAVVGGNAYGIINVKNVHVIANAGGYVKGGSHVGGIAGQLQTSNIFENCSTNVDVTAGQFFAGGIIGCAGQMDTYTNCHSTGNIAVIAGRANNANDLYRVGGIAGGWNDGKNNVFTLEGCTYSGNVSGKSTTGAVASPLEYMGYVGRGYTLNGSQGSKVIIDGTEFVQKYNTAAEAGIYDITTADGVTINLVADAEAFANAMKSDAEQIIVMLANDIDCPISTLGQQTGGSGEYKLGGESTKAITIDLNGQKLNITTTYWSVLGAKNDNAVFTIKNGTMTSSQATGTWNSYDLCFANCNYNFEDVVFEKAIALEAANKTYNIKNVSITETHDYYAMWVSAKGQNITIDGLNIESAGRGIKIDEQYVSSPEMVTMNVANATFKTAKKSAILVKSAEGATINWGAGNDIANVAADSVNPVWVDADAAAYAAKVVVNGASCIVEA